MALFSLVAVVPAILIALVFGVLVNRGVDQWFSQNVRSAVENGADIGRAYVDDVGRASTVFIDLRTFNDQVILLDLPHKQLWVSGRRAVT